MYFLNAIGHYRVIRISIEDGPIVKMEIGIQFFIQSFIIKKSHNLKMKKILKLNKGFIVQNKPFIFVMRTYIILISVKVVSQ